ncbi:hypothetical protein LUZ63_001465 [Rhynchospora breviuscula]|uniref:TOD1/MUCI70 glycosyltransferase-like domain-containing protein n=1 Tax=Rhynchospora breviuscula TaxID=2022672 RepID=A0A9Q0CX08_9POAL|nr:hypothetical protein LUZ63_001465 [Rhynchospora breviuscula]
MINSISISISDEDDLSGRVRLPQRPRRRKPGRAARSGPLRRICRILSRWWPVLFFVAFVFLFFKVSKHTQRAPDLVRVASDKSSREDPELEGSIGNLNRLDPVTRGVHGGRELCLKILSREKLEGLDFPSSVNPDISIGRIHYKSGEPCSEENATNTGRFNSYTGYPSLHEREESFKVKGAAEVYCGFYCEKGGFKISDEDKNYMRKCKAVVSTCAFGGGDDLYQPIGMTDTSLQNVCYIAFWDEITRSTQESEGKVIGDNGMVGKWRIIVVSDLPFSDQRLNGKIPKMLSHRLFPEARYSIWVDSKSQFRRDPLGVLEALLWRTGSVLAISEHGARSNLYDEAKAIVRKNKATPEEVEVQLRQYRLDGMPEDKRFNGKKALAEASIIVREHTPSTNLFMCLWFNEVVRFTSRDQLSFPYVMRRLNLTAVNMFPVCTRKDLVNSMGHKRKVKPLLRENGAR